MLDEAAPTSHSCQDVSGHEKRAEERIVRDSHPEVLLAHDRVNVAAPPFYFTINAPSLRCIVRFAKELKCAVCIELVGKLAYGDGRSNHHYDKRTKENRDDRRRYLCFKIAE